MKYTTHTHTYSDTQNTHTLSNTQNTHTHTLKYTNNVQYKDINNILSIEDTSPYFFIPAISCSVYPAGWQVVAGMVLRHSSNGTLAHTLQKIVETISFY